MEMFQPSETSLRTARVLVVDDIEFSIDLAVLMLRSAGIEHIITTTDPAHGLALCHDDPPDLILLDYNMPGMDGPAFIERMRAILGKDAPPVLMITAENSEASRRRALETGAIDYVIKPFTAWELTMRARNLLQLNMLHRAERDHSRLLERMVQEQGHELERARIEIINRLCSAGEFRDQDTGQHVLRIGRLAGALARLTGMDAAYCSMLTHAAPLHDIGKIGIPDRVLLKQGPLDPDEWDLMRSHCALGARILSGSNLPLLDMAAEVALYHHERWDGSGYPGGLSGENIPLTARIVAVCDVFDALLSHRPYKQPWTLDKALAHLASIAGSHLDPYLTRLFLDHADEMQAIRESLRDAA